VVRSSGDDEVAAIRVPGEVVGILAFPVEVADGAVESREELTLTVLASQS
jgi:hypothetical protein